MEKDYLSKALRSSLWHNGKAEAGGGEDRNDEETLGVRNNMKRKTGSQENQTIINTCDMTLYSATSNLGDICIYINAILSYLQCALGISAFTLQISTLDYSRRKKKLLMHY